MRHPAHRSGDIGELEAALDLRRLGFDILTPLSNTLPFDLVAYKGGKFHRIQVKYRGPILKSKGLFMQVLNLTSDEVDCYVVYYFPHQRCYYFAAKDLYKKTLWVKVDRLEEHLSCPF